MIDAHWKRNVEPPELASDLIALALRDLSWVERHDTYTIEMSNWIKHCSVCFAGAVMARRFKIPDGPCGPNLFSYKWGEAFWALNAFRQGHISRALSTLGIKRHFNSVKISPYGVDPVKFKHDIGCLITLLRRKGL